MATTPAPPAEDQADVKVASTTETPVQGIDTVSTTPPPSAAEDDNNKPPVEEASPAKPAVTPVQVSEVNQNDEREQEENKSLPEESMMNTLPVEKEKSIEENDQSQSKKVVVLGLPFSLGESEVWKNMQERFGMLENAQLVKDKMTGRSRGFAFVRFADIENAKRALAASGTFSIGGRQIEVKPALPQGGQPKEGFAAAKSEHTGHHDTRLFVAKISPEITKEEASAYFSSFGEIDDFYMPMGNQGNHRGIGFLSYKDNAIAEHVVATKGHQIRGVEIVVDKAKHRQGQQRGGPPPQGGYPGYGNPYGGGQHWGYGHGSMGRGAPAYNSYAQPYQSAPSMYPPSNTHATKIARQHAEATAAAHVRLFVGRLPPGATDEEVRAYFAQYGAIQDLFIPKDVNTGLLRNFCFVTYSDPASTDLVLAQTHHELRPGHPIAVDRATPPRGSSSVANDYGSYAPPTQYYDPYGQNAYMNPYGYQERGGYGGGYPSRPNRRYRPY